MKKILICCIFFYSVKTYSQNVLPVIKASSKTAYIFEGDNGKIGWSLSPQTRPDIYEISKSPKAKYLKFRTDIDSLEIKLKPGQHFDFVVLLNGKDSCFTSIRSAAIKDFSKTKPAIHDTIPFVLSMFNNIIVKAILNGKDTLDLKFDSGTTGFLLTNEALKMKVRSANIENSVNSFKIGNSIWNDQQIIPVVLSGQGTDGRFGWDLFDGKLVEIDYNKNRFIIHSTLQKVSKDYEKLPIEYINGLFCINAQQEVQNKKYKNRFLFDNGYQRTIMLDTTLLSEQNFPKDIKVIKKVVMKNGQGKEVPVITVNNEKLHIGKTTLHDIPAQIMTSINPAGFKTHILGNEVLKRFNTILDFQKNCVYLKPNNLLNVYYTDEK